MPPLPPLTSSIPAGRQGDPTPRQIAAPGYRGGRAPGQERGQVARPIDFGRIRQPTGSERATVPPLPAHARLPVLGSRLDCAPERRRSTIAHFSG
jgi:hypothetical protein